MTDNQSHLNVNPRYHLLSERPIMHRPLSSRSKQRVFALVAAALLLFIPTLVRADTLRIDFSPAPFATSGLGEFDVNLTNTSNAIVTIEAFSFGLLSSDTNVIDFTAVSNATTSAAYIFSVNGGIIGPDISSTLGTTLVAGDLDSMSGTDILPGHTFGLGHVSFTYTDSKLNPLTSSVLISLDPSSSATNFFAPGIVDITGTINGPAGGPFTLGVDSATPEPATIALALQAVIGCGLLILNRNRARRRLGSSTSRES